MTPWNSVPHQALGVWNPDARQHSWSIFSVPVISLTSSLQPHTPHAEDAPILQTGTGRLRGCRDPPGATQLLNGGTRLERSCGAAGLEFSTAPLSRRWLPSPVGVWTVALFWSGTLASLGSLGVQDAKMLGRPRSGCMSPV